MAKNVFSGLVTPCRFAGSPTSRSPSSVKATMEGVVLEPSAFSSTLGLEPSLTATQELVVPRSMPMTLAMLVDPLLCGRPPGPNGGGVRLSRGPPQRPSRSGPLELRLLCLAYIVGAVWACNGHCQSWRPAATQG